MKCALLIAELNSLTFMMFITLMWLLQYLSKLFEKLKKLCAIVKVMIHDTFHRDLSFHSSATCM